MRTSCEGRMEARVLQTSWEKQEQEAEVLVDSPQASRAKRCTDFEDAKACIPAAM